MKGLWLMLACGFCSAAYAQQQTDTQELARALDVLIAAYNGAQQEIARQEGRPAATISLQQSQALQTEVNEALQTLTRFADNLRQGQVNQAADYLQNLQAQINRASGNHGQQLAEAAQYLRRGGHVYQEWQAKQGISDITQANAAQIEDLVNAAQKELAQGSQTERKIAQAVSGLWGVLKVFDKVANAPEPYAAEQQAMQQEIAALKALAEQQGISGAAHRQAEGLLQLLKLRAAEHSINMIEPQADKQLLHSLEAVLRQPQAIFSPQQFAAAERLLAQLGDDFRDSHRLWNAQKNLLIRQ